MKEFWLLDNVTRWLNHEEYAYGKEKNNDVVFQINLKNFYGIHVFEPKKQNNILVIGTKIKIPPKIHKLYYESYSENDKKKLIFNLENHAKNIGAIHRFYQEPDRIKSGVYVILDSHDKLNFSSFKKALQDIIEMGNKMNTFLINFKGLQYVGNGKPSQSNWMTRWGGKWQDLGPI